MTLLKSALAICMASCFAVQSALENSTAIDDAHRHVAQLNENFLAAEKVNDANGMEIAAKAELDYARTRAANQDEDRDQRSYGVDADADAIG